MLPKRTSDLLSFGRVERCDLLKLLKPLNYATILVQLPYQSPSHTWTEFFVGISRVTIDDPSIPPGDPHFWEMQEMLGTKGRKHNNWKVLSQGVGGLRDLFPYYIIGELFKEPQNLPNHRGRLCDSSVFMAK